MRRTLILLVLVLPTAIALGQQFNGYSRRPRRTNNSTPTYTRPRPSFDGPATRAVEFVVDPKPDLTGPYRILLNRSIFAANHMVLDQRPGQLGGPEGQLALRGVSLEDGVYSAFIEDTINHSVLRVATGQAIARGLVAEITLDAVHYQREGSKTEVKIGQTLEGYPAPSTSALSASEGRFGRRGGNVPTGRFGRGANASFGRPGLGNSSAAAGRMPNRPKGNTANPAAGRNTNGPGNAMPDRPDENEGDFNPPAGGPPDLGPGSGPGDGPLDGRPAFAPPDEGPGGPPDGPGFGGPPGGPPPEVDGGPGPGAGGPPGGPEEGPGPVGPSEGEALR
ncbi:MAG TPA: hypothetical protein VFW23_00410 [Tepidisphaeraceae bacterium]|nr:hypothetical protein [Tepidisphaeraceae bacterium]